MLLAIWLLWTFWIYWFIIHIDIASSHSLAGAG